MSTTSRFTSVILWSVDWKSLGVPDTSFQMDALGVNLNRGTGHLIDVLDVLKVNFILHHQFCLVSNDKIGLKKFETR